MTVRWDGARQRALRQAANLSLERLAIAIGRSAATVISYELQRCTPSLVTAYAISTELGVNVADLLTNDAAPPGDRIAVGVAPDAA
jgi:transcriptional regulator with XRE-family HTH domain